MNAEAKQLYSVINDIRLCFNLLRGRVDEMLHDMGINASMRAVMENLSGGDEKTVPDIGRSRGVSRQHIQVIVNSLIKDNLVKTRDNPDDKRTFLVSLTSKGQETFSEIQKREAVELKRWAKTLSTYQLDVTQDTLRDLISTLKGTENE